MSNEAVTAMFGGLESSLTPVFTLARGGMGTVTVSLLKQGPVERFCAVKRLHPQFADDAEFLAMFQDEAHLASLLRHPNVVSVLAAGQDDEGPYLVMDYVEGPSASQMLKWHVDAHKSLPLRIALEIAVQTAEGLQAAHELQDVEGRPLELVHRDVSPQNILLGLDGVVRLTDFGIAKALGSSSKTSTGYLKGKHGYMAPEQLRFQPATQRSDLFSLGVVLFELLAGRRLYSGGLSKAALEILEKPSPDILDYREDAPDSIVELLFELLAKAPADRPSRARDVAERLRSALDDLIDPGPTMAAYVGELFGEELIARKAEIQATLANARSEAKAPRAKSRDEDSEETLHTPQLQGSTGGRAGRWRGIVFGILFVVGVLAGGLIINASLREGAERSPATAIVEDIPTSLPTPALVLPTEEAEPPASADTTPSAMSSRMSTMGRPPSRMVASPMGMTPRESMRPAEGGLLPW